MNSVLTTNTTYSMLINLLRSIDNISEVFLNPFELFFHSEVLGSMVSIQLMWVLSFSMIYAGVKEAVDKTYIYLDPDVALVTSSVGLLCNIL